MTIEAYLAAMKERLVGDPIGIQGRAPGIRGIRGRPGAGICCSRAAHSNPSRVRDERCAGLVEHVGVAFALAAEPQACP